MRVSLVCFGIGANRKQLDGFEVQTINSDLTAGGVDLAQAKALSENAGAWAYGSQEKGNFSVMQDDARRMLAQPNPHGRPNSDVLKKAVNARQAIQRREDDWVVDFGLDMPSAEGRTLTNLYNARPAWLDNAYKALDAAVAAAYGWDDYTPAMPEDAILSRLLALNLERTRAQTA